jgi:hypothetical protein
MKKSIYLLAFCLFLAITVPAIAVDVKEDATSVIITTAGYEVHWKKAAQMGYHQAFVAGSKETIIATAGRAFYHSGQYGGNWYDWGALQKWEISKKETGKTIVKYTADDGGQKAYSVLATYYDSVPYIKHEITITNTKDAELDVLQSGHTPMFEVGVDMTGMKVFAQPYPYGSYWTKSGFFGALYGPKAQSADLSLWGTRDPGRMQLTHDNLNKKLKKNESFTFTYYVAFGKGGEKEATDLASKVQTEPATTAVSSKDALSTTWGHIRSGY